MPALRGIIETALYVSDLRRAAEFYEQVLALQSMAGDDRFRAYSVAGRDVLLLFKSGATTKPVRTPAGVIPPHDGAGQNHFAFAIDVGELDAWDQRLAEHGIAVEGRVDWPAGGTSIYFRDPDGNLVELATPGMWPIY